NCFPENMLDAGPTRVVGSAVKPFTAFMGSQAPGSAKIARERAGGRQPRRQRGNFDRSPGCARAAGRLPGEREATMISDRTIGRLSLYRRLLRDLLADGEQYIFSHQLATLAGGTAAQVRRDIMAIGYTGSPVH